MNRSNLHSQLRDLQRVARRHVSIRAGLEELASSTEAERSDRTIRLAGERPELRALGAVLAIPAESRISALQGTPLKNAQIEHIVSLAALLEARPTARQALSKAMPFSMPPAASTEWDTYKATVAELGRQPVFGDESAVALGDIYVPARFELRKCAYETARHRLLESARVEPDETGVDAIARVLRLLEDGPEPVFVVGLPGIGKSSFARMLAARLAQSERWHPVFLPLRKIVTERPLDEQIREHLRAAGAEATLDDLAQRFEQAPDVVLVLDGFDELSSVGREGHQGFFLQARELARELGLRLVLTGRDTLLTSETSFPRGSSVLRLLDFDEGQVRAWCARWEAATGAVFDATAHLSEEASGIDPLVRQPLLLYLLAHLQREGVELPAASDATPARLFQQIVSELCARYVADRPGAGLTAGRLRRLLGVAGWVAMVRGASQVGRDDLDRAIDANLSGVDAEQVVELARGTLLASYFRRVSEDEWEFTHKSFGEYLAAEHLAGVVHSLTTMTTDPFGEQHRVLSEAAAAEAFIEAFGPSMVPMEVERWLPDMLADWPGFLSGRTAAGDGLIETQERLLELVPRLLDEVDAETSLRVAREWDDRLTSVTANALFNATATAGRAAEERGERLDLMATCDGRWEELQDMLRLVAGGDLFEERLTGRMVLVDPQPEELEEVLHRTQAPGLRVEGGTFDSDRTLVLADMRNGVFSGVRISALIGNSNLCGLDGRESDWTGAQFLTAFLFKSDFRGAVLRNAVFTNCSLVDARFDGAVLDGASFEIDAAATQLDGKLDADGHVLPAYLDDAGRFRPDGAPGKTAPSKKKASKK